MNANVLIEGSRRLGTLRGDQLQAALQRFDCGDFISAAPIPHGLFGQNVFITSTRGEFVLRGKPHFPWQFPKERFFCDAIKRQTNVPVAHPYLLDESTEIFGWAYMLMPRMPGKYIPDKAILETLTIEDRTGIARAMGEMLAELHRCQWPHCGEFDLGTHSIKPLEMAFPKWVCHHFEKSIESCAGVPELNPADDLRWLHGEIERLAPAMEVPFTPCAVMNDYREGNATCDIVNGRWQATGLFDLMEFFIGDGEMDLSRQCADYIQYDKRVAAAFVSSYLSHRPARPRFAERFRLYMLADRLQIWDYGIHHGWFKAGETLRKYMERYLEFEAIL